ncbi:MAG: hypothetical protein JSR44_06315 [Spirochaetes bacterium]|nr:hypothetical protein [Spirochaetota bacterium]
MNKLKRIYSSVRKRLPTTAQVAGAIRGVVGDKLPARFKGEMAFFAQGKKTDTTALKLRAHVCIFVHGSSDTEAGWAVEPPGLSFGDQLLVDFGVTPLYIRYNTGNTVRESGEALAALVELLFTRHRSVRKLTLIGHSMGGLVIHSAIYHARSQKYAWLKKLTQVFLLGTPHAGAPLAKAAEKSEQILQFIPTPFTLIAASILGLRSKGLKDLSHGDSSLPLKGKILQSKVRYVFIAGTLQKKPRGVLNRLFGDGMVRERSAHSDLTVQKNWLERVLPEWLHSPLIKICTVNGVGHLGLRNSPHVYECIAGVFFN